MTGIESQTTSARILHINKVQFIRFDGDRSWHPWLLTSGRLSLTSDYSWQA